LNEIAVKARGFGGGRRGPALRTVVVVAGIVALLAPGALIAQADRSGSTVPAAQQRPRCAPIPAERGATITFGREGGNIRPRSYAIFADGRVTAGVGDAARDSVGTIPAAAVAALARLARSGGFWELRSPAVRRPPGNPDAAREFIGVTLTCGAHRVEFVAGAEPAAFVELFALLSAVARVP